MYDAYVWVTVGSWSVADEIRITFGSRDDHTCSTSLYNLDDDMELSAWPPNIIIGENKFTARLGPSGGVRGYASITGKGI